MSNFIGRPPFSNSLWVGIETMQFHIAQTKIFLRTPSFPIQGVPMNNLAPMKNCPGGVQGNLNWMPGYCILSLFPNSFNMSTHVRSSISEGLKEGKIYIFSILVLIFT